MLFFFTDAVYWWCAKWSEWEQSYAQADHFDMEAEAQYLTVFLSFVQMKEDGHFVLQSESAFYVFMATWLEHWLAPCYWAAIYLFSGAYNIARKLHLWSSQDLSICLKGIYLCPQNLHLLNNLVKLILLIRCFVCFSIAIWHIFPLEPQDKKI